MQHLIQHFSDLITDPSIHHFCLDASGVLYNKPQGLIAGVKQHIEQIQSLGKGLFLVTNNSMLSPHDIASYLKKQGIAWPENTIFSSGLGCSEDPEICNVIKNKNVYISGHPSSHYYVTHAKRITSKLDESDTIILTSNPNGTTKDNYKELIRYINQNPHIMVICCNPDRYINSNSEKYPVIGYWADYIQTQINTQIINFGKPYSNYFNMVKNILSTQFGITDLSTCCYVDDYIKNVTSCPLNMKKIWAKESGLGLFFDATPEDYEKIDGVVNNIGR